MIAVEAIKAFVKQFKYQIESKSTFAISENFAHLKL